MIDQAIGVRVAEAAHLGDAIASEIFRSELKQIVRIHQAMFERLLCDPEEDVGDLAVLFRDAGTTYLDIAQRISAIRQGPAGH